VVSPAAADLRPRGGKRAWRGVRCFLVDGEGLDRHLVSDSVAPLYDGARRAGADCSGALVFLVQPPKGSAVEEMETLTAPLAGPGLIIVKACPGLEGFELLNH
jgi:hypothetical protein